MLVCFIKGCRKDEENTWDKFGEKVELIFGHLLFANESLLFARANSNEVDTCLTSYLYMKLLLDKNMIWKKYVVSCSRNASDERKNTILLMLKLKAEDDHEKYLDSLRILKGLKDKLSKQFKKGCGRSLGGVEGEICISRRKRNSHQICGASYS